MTTHPESSPLIGAAALREMRDAPELLLVDCRYDLAQASYGRDAYAAGHLPGARFASMDEDLSAPRRPDTGRHPLPAPATFAAALGRWGFTGASRVVAYDQGHGAYAARLWWMLRARGHRAVQVLDGGVPAWLEAGGPLSTVVPEVRPTAVDAAPFDGVLTAAEVAGALAARAITLVDARGADRFAGRNETIDPVPGHVPGALNHPFTLNLSASQRFLPREALRERWAHVLDRPARAPLVSMCGSGITACHNLLALEVTGHAGARLYAGSYSDWITDPARPVSTEEYRP